MPEEAIMLKVTIESDDLSEPIVFTIDAVSYVVQKHIDTIDISAGEDTEYLPVGGTIAMDFRGRMVAHDAIEAITSSR
jgi:hypothetical protein